MGAQVLNNKLNPNYEPDCLNLIQFEAIVRRLDLNFELAKYFAAKANAIVVSLPAVPESDMALLDDFMNIARELGETSQRFQAGFADGVITQAEYLQISKEVHDTVAALLQFEQSVARVVR
ncbi:phage regulatory CII family protein [Methylophilus sp. VKM B-3414]|uniref:phage regulatory CII family protein n=1 Tax=Methylophilus sp. VKM B-3414 TaxID=3076121 RepID=UPI0028C94730|nr:phage regulatory CII family protein [Methylophilus sp. VKM B-3414]MDT7849934.1 phage regulatory CII family protein [Methylophilus sp. VKM B-3414]